MTTSTPIAAVEAARAYTERRLTFLAEAGEALSSSLDYEQTLCEVARLAVPVLGDMCIVDVNDDGVLRRVATAHMLPAKAELLDELRRLHPPSPDSPQPAGRVLRSGAPELLVEVTPQVAAAHTRDAQHLQLILRIGIRSHLAVPLIARGAIVGVISLGITESNRQYGAQDVELAMELARRAALAVDNARLYRAAQRELAERGRVEEELRISETRFRAVMEQSPLSTQIFSPDGKAIRVNKAWEELWGVKLEQIPDYNILRDPQLVARGIDGYVRRAFAGEAVEIPAIRYDPNETLPNRTRNVDSARWVRAFAYPIKDARGAVREVVLVHEDVTARVNAETQLRSSEEATKILADAGETLGASLDADVTLQNLARVIVPRLGDWCAIDLLGDADTIERATVFHPDPKRVALAMELFQKYPPRRSNPFGVWHVLRTGEAEWSPEISDALLEAGAHDAEHLALLRELGLKSYVCVPLIARGSAIGALTIVYAESDRRYRASDVEVAKDLARRAAAAVDNARLYQRVREEDRRKDEFLATLAHELRNPLAPLRSGLEVLRFAPSGPPADKARAIMERQLSHMVRLIDDLLDLSRVTSGKIELHQEMLDVGAVVANALEVSGPAIEAAGLELALRLPKQPIVFRGDRTRMAQVLSNILNNAAKYTPRGGRVLIEAERDHRDVVIRVRDTGIGIPREMLAQVFEIFAQVEGSSTRGQGGLGIGLTLVRRLVELHGGRVWAESDGRDRGSTFVVRLPALTEESHADARAEPRQASARPARRLLVVDDNTDAADLLSMLLELDGHEVRTASNGPDALELVRDFHPDVAFLDIGLPGMNGYDLARRLREQPQLSGMLLVAVTGWGQAEDRRQSSEAGFDHHLTKPVNVRDVQLVIESLNPRS